VLSGSVAAIEDAMARLEAHGAKMVKRLNVSGAFHSGLMRSAAAALAEFLDGIVVRDATVPVVANVTAQPATEAALLRDLLKRQIASPVRWDESLRTVRALDRGPRSRSAGRRARLRRIDRDAVCTIGDRAGLRPS
jgi:[acyl-carrier-protein] S-malonyltransferase